MNVFTIGFTQKSASVFFELLRKNGIKTLLDVRLNNVSQLSGFAKRDDLKFFLDELVGIKYHHVLDLAPSKTILENYQKKIVNWETYEQLYLEEISKRSVERLIEKEWFDHGCLLCSEHKPHFCHRRVAVEYLNSVWNLSLNVKHLI